MDVNTAITAADTGIFSHTGEHLNSLERTVLKGCLQGLSYQAIADDTYQSYKYIKDVGAQLFRKLSAPLGEKIKKGNVQIALDRYCAAQGQALTHSLIPFDTKDKCSASILLHDYRKRYEDNYGYIKILPRLMQKPLPLDSIYVAVKVLDKSSINLLSTITVEEAYRQFHKRDLLGSELVRQDGIAVAEKNQYLMVLGGPGVGKSTFLKKIGLEAFSKERCIPIFIELKQLARAEETDLTQYIESEIFQQSLSGGEANTKSLVTAHLREGNFLILLDGLDEVAEERMSEVTQQIQSFIKRNDKNRFIISCRTAAHTLNFTRFVDVIIAEFNDVQIRQFIEYWFDATSLETADPSKQIWKRLSASKNASIKDLARSPLLLTYLCLICERDQSLPNTRKDLYAKALNIILEGWDKQKGVANDRALSKDRLDPYLETKLLSEIAYDNFQNDQLFFSKDYLLEKISHFLKGHFNEMDGSEVASAFHTIEIRQGVLVERFIGSFCFSHLTFQEYLTAYFTVKNRLVEQLLEKHLTDSRWREVFLLASELMEGSAPALIELIYKRATSQVSKYPKLKELLNCCNRFIDKDSTLSSRASVITAVTAIASARSSDIHLTVFEGRSIGTALTKACGSVMALSTEDTAAHKTVVTCVVAVVCARALSYDLLEEGSDLLNVDSVLVDAGARAASIDSVVHNAGEMINDASDDKGLLSHYVRRQVVTNSISFAREILNAGRGEPSFLSGVFSLISQNLDLSLEAIPKDSSAQKWYLWARDFELSWLETLGIGKDIISLSVEEADAWKDYLYITELSVRCMKSVIQMPIKELETFENRCLV